MAEKRLHLHPSQGFFLSAGLHLVNPERPSIVLPEGYVAPDIVVRAIKSGILIDINRNILTEDGKPSTSKSQASGPKQEEAKVEAPEAPAADEDGEEEKPKGRAKKTK